jgi:hypothetical protein
MVVSPTGDAQEAIRMGYSTDFIGHIEIRPALNDAEIEYLEAFTTSRRCRRPGGPYDVPGNPRAETFEDFPTDVINRVAAGQPDFWCDWSVCWEGCCLAWSGKEKSYAMVPWLKYLIGHFLRPGAAAAKDTRFEEFTFDHRLSGMVVGCRRTDKELFAIRVSNNRVTERVLNPGDRRFADAPLLPYEAAIDRDEQMFRRRRRRRQDRFPADGDNVVPISGSR